MGTGNEKLGAVVPATPSWWQEKTSYLYEVFIYIYRLHCKSDGMNLFVHHDSRTTSFFSATALKSVAISDRDSGDSLYVCIFI